MVFQTIFKRYELKYLLTEKQKEKVLMALEPYMVLDQYGRTTIRNVYLDTENYRLARRSIENPAYKEKLRIRSYKRAEPGSTVFVELKKKYQKVVYKRRIALPEREAMEWVTGKRHCRTYSQIASEVDYFLQYYGGLGPAVFLSYEREAFCSKDQSDFRITFDEKILCRREHMSLECGAYGIPLLPRGQTLMEIKCSGGVPLWLLGVLGQEKIYKGSFSKYGTAYKTVIYPSLRKEAAYYA